MAVFRLVRSGWERDGCSTSIIDEGKTAMGTVASVQDLSSSDGMGIEELALPPSVQAALRRKGWQFYTFLGATGCRLMCAWDTDPTTVDRFAADMASAEGLLQATG